MTPDEMTQKVMRSKLLDGIAPNRIRQLIEIGTVIDAEPGVVVIQEGAFVPGVHLIVEGEVEVIKQDRTELAKLEAGACFGEICLLGQSITATATLIASMQTCILVVRQGELEDWFGDDLASQAVFFRNLSGELAQKLANTSELLSQALGT